MTDVTVTALLPGTASVIIPCMYVALVCYTLDKQGSWHFLTCCGTKEYSCPTGSQRISNFSHQVALSKDRLNDDDVFILDLGRTIIQWNGRGANKDERFKVRHPKYYDTHG